MYDDVGLFSQAEANIEPKALAQMWYSFITSQKVERVFCASVSCIVGHSVRANNEHKAAI